MKKERNLFDLIWIRTCLGYLKKTTYEGAGPNQNQGMRNFASLLLGIDIDYNSEVLPRPI
jgi:hypothetical protein